MEAFDYHLPPPHLSPADAKLVHPDPVDLSRWGLTRDSKGCWTMSEGRGTGGGLASVQRRRVEPREALWPARLAEMGLR